MFRLAVSAAVILVGVMLTVSTFFSGVRDASLLGFAQAVTSVLVTLHLLRALRKGRVPPEGQTGTHNPDGAARMIALGFVIATLALILCLWWLTTVIGPR